ncbi:MAG: hypothetical protein ACFFBD_00010 [Candidatus Hodarchaeota archaeon]
MIGTLKKLYNRKRAISPVISAILLIGLAVAAGAILIVVVIPLLTPAPNVILSEAVGIDRNADGDMDKLTIKLANQGTASDTLSAIDAPEFAGWTAPAPNTEIPVSTTGLTELVWECTDADEQIGPTITWSVTLTLGSGNVIDINHDDETTDVTLTQLTNEAAMLIDFTASGGSAIAWPGTISVNQGNSANNAAHADSPGLEIDVAAAGSVGYVATGSSIGSDADLGLYANQVSSAIWDKSDKPIIGFWLKTNGTINISVRVTVYDGVGEHSIITYNIGSFSTTIWTRIYADLSDTTSWTGGTSGWEGLQYCGGLRFVFSQAGDGAFIDDIGVFDGL